MHSRLQALAVAAVLLMLTSTAPSLGDEGRPLADETTRFDDVTEEAGLGGIARTRVAWGDYDGDGWEDLLLDGRQLMRNDGDGTFTDVTSQAGIRGVASHGGVWADYDNDGDADFYANVRSMTARDALWRNDGDGTFTDVTSRAGQVSDLQPTEGVAWGDYDEDGFLDLYVANYETASVDPDAELGIGTPDALYRNQGDGTFEDMSARAGIELDEELCGRGVVWADYDDDGDADIYVSNYRLDPNLLWRNDGDGTFTNVAREARVEGYSDGDLPGSSRFGHSIGSDFGDYDNDGDMDLYVSNLAHPRFIMFSDKSMLMKNRGDGTFIDRWYGSGIAYCETSSDAGWADYDNDGDLDLYFTAVYEDRLSRLFRNVARDRFEDSTGESRTAVDNGWGTGWCDYDHDGDLDLAVGSGTEVRLLRNGGNLNHWFQVELEGRYSNRDAVGARVRVTAAGQSQVRDVKAGRGTTSQDMHACHFGLADHYGPVEVDIRWPGENVWTDYGTYDVDQRVHIVEGDLDADASIALEATPDRPRVGDPVTLTAIVENLGSVELYYVDVGFYVQGGGPIGESILVGPLEPGEEGTAVTLWQPLMEGTFTLQAIIMGVAPTDINPDNDDAYATVTVQGANSPPIARLEGRPSQGPPGMDFTLDGSASSDDDTVAAYLFEFGDGNETGWTSSSIVSHAYSLEGQYLASLTVRDADGVMSTNFATVTITVTSKGYRPEARIVTVLPSPARVGEVVTLHGSGTGKAGANITGYSWSSSVDGPLGTQALITVSSLSMGEHTLFFKVQDERGLWSDPVSEVLTVLPVEGRWSVEIAEPREGARPAGDALVVRGTADYSAARVVSVEVRVDNGPWEQAEGTEQWIHTIDLAVLADGPHTIRVRASTFYSTSDLYFVNFTLGDVDGGRRYGDLRDRLLTLEGILAVIALLVIVNAVIYLGYRSREREAAPRRR